MFWQSVRLILDEFTGHNTDHKVHRDPNGLGVNEFEDFKAVKEVPNDASFAAAVSKATEPARLADYVYFQRHESVTAYGVQPFPYLFRTKIVHKLNAQKIHK